MARRFGLQDDFCGCLEGSPAVTLYSSDRRVRSSNQVLRKDDLVPSKAYHAYCDVSGTDFTFVLDSLDGDQIIVTPSGIHRLDDPPGVVASDRPVLKLSLADFGVVPYRNDGFWNIVNYLTANGSH
ncbi:MAG: hypothetical protein AABW73_02155 [Nanoarchaeota archaeon]